MALDKSALLELTEALSSADGGQLMRKLLHTSLQALIDAEAAEHIGADPQERTDARTTYRNGTRDKTTRDKTVSTTSGDLTVKIAKTRTGSFFPSLLTPRRRLGPQGPPPGGSVGRRVGDLQERGLTDLRRAGHRRGRVQHPRPQDSRHGARQTGSLDRLTCMFVTM